MPFVKKTLFLNSLLRWSSQTIVHVLILKFHLKLSGYSFKLTMNHGPNRVIDDWNLIELLLEFPSILYSLQCNAI